MKKYRLVIIALASLLLTLAGCSTDKDVKATLGEEFSLRMSKIFLNST